MSDDALLPLRRAYGAEVPGSPAAGAALGAAARTETAVLVQTRAAIEAAIAAQDRRPSAAVLAAVLARAADASTEALAPLAAVHALYTDGLDMPETTEAAILSQTRAAVELAMRPAAPSAAALAAVLAYAADATRLAPRPDAVVAAQALAPLAVAYGLPTSAPHDAVETALLVQTRDLLDRRPVPAGPSDAVLAAVLAQAAALSAPPARPDVPTDRPATTSAADRAPMRDARRLRRIGAWASAGAMLLALVVALMPRTSGAPELPAATGAALAQADLAVVTPAPSALAEPTPSPDVTAETPSASAPASAFMAAGPPPTAAAPAPVQRAAPLPDVAVGPGPSAPPPAARSVRQEPRPVQRAETRSADPTTALAAANVTPTEPTWDSPSDVRVLSLRLQALGRNTADLGWDTPAEAFGAPSPGSGRSTPGVQSVRQTVPAARARLSTDFSTGDR